MAGDTSWRPISSHPVWTGRWVEDVAAHLAGQDQVEQWLDPKPGLDNQITAEPGWIGLSETLRAAVANEARVAIFADYDVDGLSSAAMWAEWLEVVGCRVDVTVPEGRDSGYGLDAAILEGIINPQPDLLLVLDTGSGALEMLEAAENRAMPVLVVDHHPTISQQHGEIAGHINPNAVPSGDPSLRECCTSALSLLILAAMQDLVPSQGWNKAGAAILASLGVRADAVPLRGVNRAISKIGARLARNRPESLPAVHALAAHPKLGPATDAAFQVTWPALLNAPGRMGQTRLAYDLLRAKPDQAGDRLNACIKLNERRKREVDGMLREALDGAGPGHADGVVVAGSPKWRAGLAGVAAARLKDAGHGVVCVFGRDSRGRWAGSLRSDKVDAGWIARKAYEEGVALRGGGHRAAAGICLADGEPTTLEAFREWVGANLSKVPVLDPPAPPAPAAALTRTDLRRGADLLCRELGRHSQRLEPFGQKSPRPCFLWEAAVHHRSVERKRKADNQVWAITAEFLIPGTPEVLAAETTSLSEAAGLREGCAYDLLLDPQPESRFGPGWRLMAFRLSPAA